MLRLLCCINAFRAFNGSIFLLETFFFFLVKMYLRVYYNTGYLVFKTFSRFFFVFFFRLLKSMAYYSQAINQPKPKHTALSFPTRWSNFRQGPLHTIIRQRTSQNIKTKSQTHTKSKQYKIHSLSSKIKVKKMSLETKNTLQIENGSLSFIETLHKK